MLTLPALKDASIVARRIGFDDSKPHLGFALRTHAVQKRIHPPRHQLRNFQLNLPSSPPTLGNLRAAYRLIITINLALAVA
jgi:hypothetical protein